MGIVYTTYELAKEKAIEMMEELEQDIFICSTKFPSGEEFVLKTCNELMHCTKWLYLQEVPIDHKFINKDNAINAGRKIREKQRKRFILVDTVRKRKNGYSNISHYELCLI